jgi:hypothetical protein
MTRRVHRDWTLVDRWGSGSCASTIATLRPRNRTRNDKILTVPAFMEFTATVLEIDYFEE